MHHIDTIGIDFNNLLAYTGISGADLLKEGSYS